MRRGDEPTALTLLKAAAEQFTRCGMQLAQSLVARCAAVLAAEVDGGSGDRVNAYFRKEGIAPERLLPVLGPGFGESAW